MGAADIDVIGLNVINMRSLETIFDVVGEGSSAKVQDFNVADNDFSSSDPPQRWTGVTIRDRASALFMDTNVSNSTNIRHVFSASLTSTLDILRARMIGISGGRAIVCAHKVFFLIKGLDRFGFLTTSIFVNRTLWMPVPLSSEVLTLNFQLIEF